ncbi:hypothetical protein [Neorhodopirellula pilleata]|uniref:Uncharacterized protein n=1 Tax=Neorhodopirellula pilleata TaxID=2714738 RepID=A0A5C6AV61_9BACT|nr:hypothetical protein [Neorhodopirellula pilleata]TWU03853.1 hypothetical protein Pla100_07880 [Neorhodopirellula pilleata]
MSLTMFLQICGWPLLIVLAVLSIGLTLIALYLTFSVKRENLLVSFFPLTLLPILVGLVSSAMELVSAVAIPFDSGSDFVLEPVFLLMMNLIPLTAGCLAATLPVVIFVVGRAMLAWRSSGVRLIPEKQPEAGREMTDAEVLHRDTEDYLERLVRPR